MMRANWRTLPSHAQRTKRGEVANFAVQWHTERGADGETEFRAKVLSYKAFMDLKQQPSAALKTTVAIQAFVWSRSPGVMYKCFYAAGRKGRAASAHVVTYQRVGVADASLEASSSQKDNDTKPPSCHKRVTCMRPCAQPYSDVGSRVQSLTLKMIRVFEAAEGKKVSRCQTCFIVDEPDVSVRKISLVACPLMVVADNPPPPPPEGARTNRRLPQHKKVGRTSAAARMPSRCHGDFCDTVPSWLGRLHDLDLLSTLHDSGPQDGQHLVPVSVIERARLEMRAVQNGEGGGMGMHAQGLGGKGGEGQGGRADGGKGSTHKVLQAVRAAERLESGQFVEVPIPVRACGTIGAAGITVWASFSGKTTSNLVISLESPTGTIFSIDFADPTSPSRQAGGASSGHVGDGSVDAGAGGSAEAVEAQQVGGKGDAAAHPPRADLAHAPKSAEEVEREREKLDQMFGTINVLTYQLSRLTKDGAVQPGVEEAPECLPPGAEHDAADCMLRISRELRSLQAEMEQISRVEGKAQVAAGAGAGAGAGAQAGGGGAAEAVESVANQTKNEAGDESARGQGQGHVEGQEAGGGGGGGEGGSSGTRRMAEDQAADWRMLRDSDMLDANSAAEMRQREEDKFRDMRALLRGGELDDESGRQGSASAAAGSGQTIQSNLRVKKQISGVAGEQVAGVWMLRVVDQGFVSKDNVAHVLAGGISCDIIPASDGGAAGEPAARKTKLPRVATLSGHRRRHGHDPLDAREALPAPQVAYLRRTDAVEPGSGGRAKVKGKPHAYEKLIKEQSFREGAGQRSISLDELLEAPEFAPDARGPVRESAVAMSAQKLKMTEEQQKLEQLASLQSLARKNKESRTASSMSGKLLGDLKRRNPTRYHKMYLRHFRKHLNIPDDKLQQLEQLDAITFGLVDVDSLDDPSPRDTKTANSDQSHDELGAAKVAVLQEFMSGTLKMFFKWSLAVRQGKRERREAEEWQLKAPRGAREANQLLSDHLIWAEHHGLRPSVSLPSRRDIAFGGKTVAVCERCARVYARLQLHRDHAADKLVDKVRESCHALKVPGFYSGVLREPSALSLMNEKERDIAVYYKSLLHHSRHLHPKSSGRRLLLEHAAASGAGLCYPSDLSSISMGSMSGIAECSEGDAYNRSASVDPIAFRRADESDGGGGGGGAGIGGERQSPSIQLPTGQSLSPIRSSGSRATSARASLSSSPLVSRDAWLLQKHSHADAGNWQSDVAARYHSPSLGTPVRSVVGSGLSNSRDFGRASTAWPPGNGSPTPWMARWQQGVTPSILPPQPHHTTLRPLLRQRPEDSRG